MTIKEMSTMTIKEIEPVALAIQEAMHNMYDKTPDIDDCCQIARHVLEWIPSMSRLWRPISELTMDDKYRTDLLLRAPELVDLDCNEAGVGMGYWQDDYHVPCDEHGAVREDGREYGAWLACRWNMSCDEWYEVACTPTHYMLIEGPVA